MPNLLTGLVSTPPNSSFCVLTLLSPFALATTPKVKKHPKDKKIPKTFLLNFILKYTS